MKELEEFKKTDPCYKLIKEFYKDQVAKRTGVPYMNHIDEGLEILAFLRCSIHSMCVYCLHPILQSDEDFCKNLGIRFDGIHTMHLLLAMEYRRVANSYLSDGSKEDFIGFTHYVVEQALFADKFQNDRDFRKYHLGKHENSEGLEKYFSDWKGLLLENKPRPEDQSLEDLKQKMTEYVDSLFEK